MAKTVDGLCDAIIQITGEPVRSGNDVLTIKLALASSLMVHKASALESLRVSELAKKIWMSNGSVELEQSEAMMLKQVVEANPAGFFAPVLAQIYAKVC